MREEKDYIVDKEKAQKVIDALMPTIPSKQKDGYLRKINLWHQVGDHNEPSARYKLPMLLQDNLYLANMGWCDSLMYALPESPNDSFLRLLKLMYTEEKLKKFNEMKTAFYNKVDSVLIGRSNALEK